MSAYLTELVVARELLFTWAMRDFKVRYSQSILGAAWAILQPLSLMVVYSVIFSVFIRVPTDGIPYPVFAYTAVLPWSFFANSLNFAIPSLVSNMNLVSRQEFDVQQKVLERTRIKLEALEKQLAELEKNI